MRGLLLATVTLTALVVGPAVAADMPVRPPTPVSAAGWSGFYAGAHGGGGWMKETFDTGWFQASLGRFTAVDPVALNGLSGGTGHGAIFGGQFGYNWQPYANWVVGIEVDVSGTSISRKTSATNAAPDVVDSNTLQTKVNGLATARGKIGFVPWNSILVYGTGGLAIGQVTHDLTASSIFQGNSLTPYTTTATHTHFGWSAGFGADMKIGQSLVLGLLFLHYDLGYSTSQYDRLYQNALVSFDCSGPTLIQRAPPCQGGSVRSHITVDTITARASWLFN